MFGPVKEGDIVRCSVENTWEERNHYDLVYDHDHDGDLDAPLVATISPGETHHFRSVEAVNATYFNYITIKEGKIDFGGTWPTATISCYLENDNV